MNPRVWPTSPLFQSDGERELFDALYSALGEEDALIANLRITDPQHGDVEIDLVAIIADVGILVFENKGGHVTFNGQSWIQSDKEGSRKIDPHQQVLKNINAFRNLLRTSWSYGNPKTEWLLAFPGSLFGTTHIPGVARERIIDKSEIPYAASTAIKILEETRERPHSLPPDWAGRAFDALVGHSDLESDRDVALYNNHNFIRGQTHSLKSILPLIQENRRIYVKGPAGSGKTWLAFEQSSLWAEHGLKVGIMVFNRGLESYLQRKNQERGGQPKATWVGTFHNYMENIGHSAPTMQDYESERERFDGEMLAAVEHLSEDAKFDAWVVDEAQDFHDVWWKILAKTLRSESDSRLAIFGDPNQTVFGKRGTPEGEFVFINLQENLRNSKQIAEAASGITKNQIISRGPVSYEIEFIVVEDEAEVINTADDAVEHLADVELWNPGEIALLTTKHQHPAHKAQATDLEKYWKSIWNGDEVFYSTVGGFKGLERSAVVLAINGFHEGRRPEEVLYVGMTRARDRLVIVGTAQDCKLIQSASIAQASGDAVDR